MADTIARLIFEANTEQLKAANAELKKLASESGKASKSIGDGTKAQKKSTSATKANTEETKKANAVRKGEIKAYALQLSAVKKAHINAHRENIKRKESTQRMMENSAAAKALAAAKQKEKEAVKIKLAIQKAEINAYKEAIARKKKAVAAAAKLTKQQEKLAESGKKVADSQKKVTTATSKTVRSLKQASNSAAVLTGPLGGVSGRLSFLATGLDRFGAGGIAAGVAFAGLATLIKSSLAAFSAYETQMLKLEAITTATGNSAGFTAKQLDAMAIQVGRDTLASAEGIRDLQGVLLSFGQIQGDVFERAVNASVDLSAVMGVTAVSSAKTLAKALEDPIGNLTAMTRAGITFTSEEKEKIKQLAQTNQLLEAQDIILGKIEGKLKGAGAGGGLAAATDLLGENITNASIQIAKAAGLADKATTVVGALAAVFRGAEDLAKAFTSTRKDEFKELTSELHRMQTAYAILTTMGGEGIAKKLFGEKIAETAMAMAKLRTEAFATSRETSLAIASRGEAPESDTSDLDSFEANNAIKLQLAQEARMRAEGEETLANEMRLEAQYAQNQLEYEIAVEKFGALDSLENIRREKNRGVEG